MNGDEIRKTWTDKSRILIVDNNAQFADRVRLLLEATGNYIACAVDDPRRALETARSFKPDLVVVDHRPRFWVGQQDFGQRGRVVLQGGGDRELEPMREQPVGPFRPKRRVQ